MAKTVNLTVQVDDSQFKEFTKSFSELSDKIKQLTEQFKGIKSTVDQTAKSVKTQAEEMKGFLDQLKVAYSMGNKISKTIGKWATMINSIGVMLTTGAGLYGLDRLTNAMVQQRKQQLFLGGDTAGTQAMTRAAGIVSGAPGEELANIRKAMAGGPGMMALQSLGLFGRQMKPEDMLMEFYRRVQREGAAVPERARIPFAEQRGWTQIAPIETLLRLMGKGGPEALKQMEEERAKRPPPMSDQTQKVYTDLWQAMVNLKDTIINRLAKALEPTVKWFTQFIETITKGDWLGALKQIVDTINNWKKWALEAGEWISKQGKDLFQSAFNKIANSLKDITNPLDIFKGYMDALNTKFGELITKIGELVRSWFWKAVTSLFGGGGGQGAAAGAPGAGVTGLPSEAPSQGTTSSNQAPATTTTPTAAPQVQPSVSLPFSQQATSIFNRFGVTPGVPGGGPGGGAGTPFTPAPNMNFFTPGAGGGGGGSRLVIPNLGGGFGGGSTVGPGGARPAIPNFGGGFGGGSTVGGARPGTIDPFGRPYAPPGGLKMPFGLSSAGGGTGMASWSGAAQRAAPGKTSGWSAAFMTAFNQANFGGPGRMGGGRGPLDSDNWQSNRTATLRIDNVAGSNVHTLSNAMS